MAPAKLIQTEKEEDPNALKTEETEMPPYGTREWLQYWSSIEGHLPTPIDVSITGSFMYKCQELRWLNFNVYPNKTKLTNTGYTLMVSSKWKAERPYLEGGPFLEKHILSQIHFHWGNDMMNGSDHTVDKRRYPAEMQVTFFRANYMTQEEAFRHPDGVTMVCYLIKYGVNPDERLNWIIEGFPRVREAKTHTKIGPCPMSNLIPIFYEDYFLYWGKLQTVKGESYTIKWLIPRSTLFASFEQLSEFRKVWNPWDEPNLGNSRPLQERHDRHIFFINAHWNQYNSLLPIPRIIKPGITLLSRAYRQNPMLLPPQNDREMKKLLIKHVQSPIPISTSHCHQLTLEPLIFLGYWDRELEGTLLNNGKTAYFSFDSENRPSVKGGALNGEYLFDQMHFHWSGDDFSGCEHLLDGHGYAAESHFVHFKSEYGDKDEASKWEDGLVVVGFFLEAVDEDNPGFQRLARGFKEIKASAYSIHMTAESLGWLKNYDLTHGDYVTYKGSLTTPPYTECVTWIIYVEPIHISHEQIALLRQLEGPDSEPIKRNVRPVQIETPCESVIYVKPFTYKH